MIRPGAKFRNAQIGAVCALTLSCALVAAASPPQDSAATASGKSTSTKKTSTSSYKHHSSSSSSTAVKSSSSKTSGKRSHRKSSRLRGQQKIDSERAQAIQEALIREHYLTGEPAGTWNQASEEAMRRYQADHGWQSKTVPDSRALISLGLGPSKDHLLNPESAMTTVPDRPRAQATPATSHTSPATAEPAPASSSTPAPVSTPPPSEGSSPQ
ncbi:MAG: peptidoglycan-binding protein [Acidobacteriia bacterium]|nr:peptidoglycan-binding protein [Terriglobia bacterium]